MPRLICLLRRSQRLRSLRPYGSASLPPLNLIVFGSIPKLIVLRCQPYQTQLIFDE